MSAIITYSHIDNNKNMKISTHAIDSLDSYLKFVLANKEYMIWANLTDVINGDVIEQYINIKNYQNRTASRATEQDLFDYFFGDPFGGRGQQRQNQSC